MAFKDIAVILFSVKEDEAALAAAEVLASAADADLTAVLLELEPEPIYTMEGVMVSPMWADVLEEARKGFVEEKAALDARRRQSSRGFGVRELRVVPTLVSNAASVQSRHADLTVMLRPGGAQTDHLRISVFEGVLFGSGRPVLLIPPGWKGKSIGQNIAVAWNGKREAARALADAAPLLEKAGLITVLTADLKPNSDGVGPAPGVDIAAHLARRGSKVDVRNLDALGSSEDESLIAGARAVNADVLVMGGYGRARLQEWVFGGVTRAMVEKAPLPVLMSH